VHRRFGLGQTGEGFTGFSYTATGLMSMWMGRASASLGNVSQLLFGALHADSSGGIHTPTTMYYEKWSDTPEGRSMCMETPLSFTHWYQEAMLQVRALPLRCHSVHSRCVPHSGRTSHIEACFPLRI